MCVCQRPTWPMIGSLKWVGTMKRSVLWYFTESNTLCMRHLTSEDSPELVCRISMKHSSSFRSDVPLGDDRLSLCRRSSTPK
jgi:hypothetical protein